MLVELIDIKGETWWVNPAYVRIMREKKGRTEIWVTGHATTIKLQRPLAEVATEISAALQTMSASMVGPQAAIQQAQQAAQVATSAATNAAIMG